MRRLKFYIVLDVLPYIPNCTLVILALLWSYLEGEKGIYKSIPQELDEAATPRTLARYLKRAKAVCLETQQAIREVLIETREPRPWDKSFHQGLSPPESLTKRYRDSTKAITLWRSLAILLIGSKTLSVTPSLLTCGAFSITLTSFAMCSCTMEVSFMGHAGTRI